MKHDPALPWHRETMGHASVSQINEYISLALAASSNTDATYIIDADDKIAAFTGNGPNQVENADFIILSAGELREAAKAVLDKADWRSAPEEFQRLADILGEN